MSKEERYQKFTEDMEAAGFEVEQYRGRFFYDGPAVRCEYSQEHDVIRATTLRLTSDSMGRGLIIYPV